MKRNYNNYLILYLIPHGLFKDKDILNLQWSSIESLIPCLVKSLYDGSIQVRLHDFEKALTGLINAENTANMNILGKTATLWYYLTEVFHQSFGARKGNFAEELIAKWFEYYNRDGCKRLKVIKVGNRSHSLTLGKVLKQYGISSRSGKQIDFVLESRALKRVDFIELRMSEHTGGRTAQESLLDKHEELLEMLSKGLREALLRMGFREMNLVIAILFNERHELINPADKNSYNLGRLNSLINYIMQDNHIWGKVNNLTRQGYVYCDGKKIDRDSFEEKLRESLDHSVCIASNNGEFKVWFKILLGDQFFNEYMCVKFNEIKNQWFSMIADDVWLFYTLSINETKLAREFGQTSARKIYELLNEEKTSILNEFEKLYEDGRRGNLSLMNYVNRLNGLADQCVNEVINYAKKRGIELRVLETNDVTAIHEYLRQLCLAVFAIHLAMDKIDKDKAFDKCKWSEEEET